MATHEVPRVEVPKPHTFSGKRYAKELDNFLWHMERYFEAIALMDEATKVRTVTLYLTDNATLWWRQRFADIEKKTFTLDTWDAFKREIKMQFYPEDLAYLERKNMKRLKHTGSIREYVKEFSMLMLEIPNMFEEELLFNFMDNLQSWAEQELRRHGVQDLATTMVVAESLVEYKRRDSKPKPQSKGNHAKGGGDKGSQGYPSKEGSSKGPSGKDDKGKDKWKEFKPKTNCFLCDGPHWAHDCPKRKALNAMIEENEKEGDAHVGSLQLLNALKATKALVDTGATHNFVSEDEAKRLELKASKEGGWLKTVNSAAKPSHGVTHGVTMHTISWEGKVDFTMTPWMTSRWGLKRKEVTYLATLKEERDDGSGEPMPKEIEKVLNEFKDMMPLELPKRLPPRRDEDHKIELEPGAKPLAMGPYRMGPSELEELRRQLKELLDTRFIQPSKAPYGMPVLFQKKHDGSLRMCIDYQALNKVTVKNKYPILLIADLFDQLGRARYFTKLDLRLGYYQVRITEGDEPKTTCVTSNTLKEHVEHSREVFKILRQNELYVKKEKCSFAKEEVSFLGHYIKDSKLMMDGSKVKAIQEWDPPTKVPQLRSFLGLVNYYWQFIKAFEDLKKAVTEEPVLTLLDHTKVFEKKLSPKKARWQDFLTEFDYTLEYKPGSANHVVNALSRKAKLTSMTSQPQGDIMDLLREGLQHVQLAKSLITLAHE
ncbi:Transposon Ty3-I Gag-Pol polyprotein [Vitis vinifera]|uniref:Transposon Ty3-I Gag-Pol polyprotein n=1 Tax=Vitis vinifera TaxID=29760 RepID=A0A438G277_VITVI|nr:Transposon Ty3-I Gag-Pol polyprotein [Vitis vinifera]